jgi:uncharacterized membrane protein YeaQ/YmgE (transglycosylase-associated protein family)
MSAQALLVILLVGFVAGWLAGQIVQGTGFGLVADIAIGIVGALIGSWLLPELGIHLGMVLLPLSSQPRSAPWCSCLSFGSFTGEADGEGSAGPLELGEEVIFYRSDSISPGAFIGHL